MPDVLLVGAFGQRNPGDDALLTAFLRSMPAGRVVVASSDPDATEARHGCAAVPSRSAPAIAAAIHRADAVVVGGGTIFKTLHGTTSRAPHELLRNTGLLARAARTMGKPLLMVGVGAGALADRRAQRLARRLVPTADLMVLRDEESAAVLTGIGAVPPFRVGADASWVLLDAPPERRALPTRDVVVALSHLAGGSELVDDLVVGVDEMRAAGLQVALQPWQTGPGADVALAHDVASRSADHLEILEPPADLLDARACFQDARVVVGMRFHALVVAAAAGTPFVAVDHELKLGALARRFAQAAVDPGSPSDLAAATSAAMTAAPPAEAAVRSQIALAEEGFRLLRLVLDGGSTPDTDDLRGLPLEPSPWEVSA